MPNKSKQLIIIDANALIHRAYHALPPLTTRKGELVNAVYGFASILLKVLREFQPEYVVAAFDVAGPTFRSEEYREYKAKRVKAPDDLYTQIPRVKELLDAFHVPVYEYKGFEADDIIGTIAAKAPRYQTVPALEIVIVTGDLDALQLVNEHTKVYTLRKGIQDTILYGEKEVRERYGIEPEQLVDFKGLRGDPSDNIIGVPGIGEKTATQILQEFKTIEGLYAIIDKKDPKSLKPRIIDILRRHKDDAFFSKMLATIRLDAPIEFSLSPARWKEYDKQKAEELLSQLGFFSLIKRLPSGASDGGSLLREDAAGASNEKKDVSEASEEAAEIERARLDGVLSERIYTLEKQVEPVLRAMEKRGILLDTGALAKLNKEASLQLRGLEKEIYASCGTTFNINSSQQLSEILFGALALPVKGVGKTPGGELSTAASELEKFRDAHPAIPLILQYREIQKLLSTYILPLPSLRDSAGRIHTTFRQLGTATGRISSSDPNMQNIPLRSDLGRRVRDAFVPAKGMIFLSADYSQMELRIVAHLSGDEKMIEAFQNNEDIHVHTASLVFGVEEDNVTTEMRHRAKALNFGLIYGIGVHGFARNAQISRLEAKAFMERYMETFRGIASYFERTKSFAHTNGYVETMWGRKRFISDLTSQNPQVRRAAERAAINMPVQGTAADIAKEAMVEAHKKFPRLALLLHVHDELLWEASPDIVQEEAHRIKGLLEGIVPLSVPLKVELWQGFSWGSLQPLP